MALKRMLIDALHPEETRVAVLDGNRLEDIDVEVASRKQLKGNIYLAKVTRVEPSLQAAFVDYGGNRHGFLAFNEIHPDYYQIPVADREALVAEHDADERAAEAKRLAESENSGDSDGGKASDDLELIGGDDVEEVDVRRPNVRRNYKIQEVIKRRQILLIQVVKEERGNKGAAVTTYLSLAGRYCVLMPNTARGGGISRKIPTGTDRKRLKTILSDLHIPEGMGVIVRTAGAERSKAEIRRDYDYLIRLWDNVRQVTLDSIAPTLVYEEANLVKRSIRDLYSREIEEIIVEGEEGYKIARNFMKLMIPSHVKRVKKYEDESMPLFHRYQVENQQDAMHSPTVRLKSGGYIVINPTEALVSIDVNSGRSTRERNIEETALRTNLEACDEIARQLRLRDLAGLVVIDFIDMEVGRNRSQVERRLKEAMRVDRARIQLGRISPFGLMELSRQRLRPSVIETSFEICAHCGGSGVRRSTDSSALHLLRTIEDEGIRRRSIEATFYAPTDIVLYLLNHKREGLNAIERRYDFKVCLAADDSLIPPDFRVERTKVRGQEERGQAPAPEGVAAPVEAIGSEDTETTEEEPGKKRRRRRPRRRKRGEDGEATATTNGEPTVPTTYSGGPEGEESEPQDEEASGPDLHPGAEDDETEKAGKRRRRGKRGGRRRRSPKSDETEAAPETVESEPVAEGGEPEATIVAEAPADAEAAAPPVVEEKADESVAEAAEKAPPKRRRRARKPKASETTESAAPAELAVPAEPEPVVAEKQREPAHAAPAPVPADATVGDAAIAVEERPSKAKSSALDVDSPEAQATRRTPRRGWWRRS